VSVWKDARELGKAAGTFAARLASGTKLAGIKEASGWKGGTRKLTIPSVFLKPLPITADNLKAVIDAGWVTKAQVCAGVDAAKGPAACK
jgi:D-xylose transport system substrate-binding protein